VSGGYIAPVSVTPASTCALNPLSACFTGKVTPNFWQYGITRLYLEKGGYMQKEEVTKQRWQIMSGAEKFFAVVIMASLAVGFGLLVLEASGLAILPGILSSF